MEFDFNLPDLGSLFPLQEGVNDLADEKIVGLLVRGYVDSCLAGFQQAINGEREQGDVADDLYRLAGAFNEVFLGRSGLSNLTVHPWNSAEQLGAFLRDTVGLDFPPEECVRATLIHLATQVMLALQESEATWRENVEILILEVRDLLLGRIPDSGSEEPLPYA